MSVGVALDDREYLPARLTRAAGIDVTANRSQIVRQCSVYFTKWGFHQLPQLLFRVVSWESSLSE